MGSESRRADTATDKTSTRSSDGGTEIACRGGRMGAVCRPAATATPSTRPKTQSPTAPPAPPPLLVATGRLAHRPRSPHLPAGGDTSVMEPTTAARRGNREEARGGDGAPHRPTTTQPPPPRPPLARRPNVEVTRPAKGASPAGGRAPWTAQTPTPLPFRPYQKRGERHGGERGPGRQDRLLIKPPHPRRPPRLDAPRRGWRMPPPSRRHMPHIVHSGQGRGEGGK